MIPLRLASIEDDTTAYQLLPGYLCHQPEFTCSLVVGSVEELLAQLPDVLAPPQSAGRKN